MSKSQINQSSLSTALTALKLPKQDGKQIKFIELANAMGYKPKKMMKGKETKTSLKEGSTKYKEAVYNEVIRRFNEKKSKVPIVKKATIKTAPKLAQKKLVESLLSKNFQKFLYTYDGVDNVEDYRKAIKKESDELGGSIFISIPFKSKTDNKILWRSVNPYYLKDDETFNNELESILLGTNAKEGQQGSDPISLDEYEPMYDTFSISIMSSFKAHGKSDKMLFKVKGIDSKKGLCVWESLKECGIDCYKYGVKPGELKNVANLIKMIKDNNLKIGVIANGFTINKKPLDIISKSGSITIKIEGKKRDMMYECGKVYRDDIDYVFLCGNEGAEHFIVYDEINEHADYCKKIELEDDLLLSYCGKIIKNETILFTPKELNTNNLLNTKTPVEYVFFDYETIIDFNNSSCMKPYSLSILVLSPFELNDLEAMDKSGDVAGVASLRKQKCVTFLGYDCNEKFIEWFMEYQLDKMLVFVGFNNTNFDNFIMLEGFLKYKELHTLADYGVSDIFYNGSQLLNFRINGRHTTFDIRKHLVGSLKKNCESFKIKCCAKKEFNHDYAQELHDDKKLIDYITGNEDLKEYNEYDVLATAVLYKRYMNALDAIPATKKYANDLYQIKTIGSLIYKVFIDNKKKKGFELPKLDYQVYKDLQKSKIAGRVEMFNGVQKVMEQLVSTDVCSLYPFVMAVLNCYYPCGDELIEVNEYKGDDVIGFYYCDIDQSCLKGKNLPNIYAEKLPMENDWSSTNVLENYLISNVMIGLLREYGCSVIIRKGFTFPSQMKSCEMFSFLLEFMQSKNYQDLESKKEKKGLANEYNPALRETYKLLMNSLSGKVIEGLHTEKTIDIDNCADFLKVQEKATKINFINAVGGKMFLTYEVDAESVINQQRPIYLGVLIYDYAKRYMYQNSYSKIGKAGLLYTDTDASKFRYKDFINWKKWVDDKNIQVPHWPEVEAFDERYKNHKIYDENSKVFGSFEDELEDAIGDDYLFYCLEKKSWLYAYKKDGKWKTKYRFKGLNGSAQMLTMQEPFLQVRTIEHKAKGDKEAYNEIKYVVKPESEYDVYKYYLAHKNNNIENGNEINFFEKIYSTGTAYVMCNSFRKIVKNSSRNVDMDDKSSFNNLMNKIQVNYMIKKIQIKSIANIYNGVLNQEGNNTITEGDKGETTEEDGMDYVSEEE
jgi:hypothetical protein